MRVLRVYHAGREPAHRARERALVAAGVDVTLVAPAAWQSPGAERRLSSEPFRVLELPVRRPGDVNRHSYRAGSELADVIADVRPDLLDVHEEPFSVAARQWLQAAPEELPVVLYTAQNIDKRYPQPFARWEQRAHRRAQGLYPCSYQAASVARGKGFSGLVEVLPLGYDPDVYRPGTQAAGAEELLLAFVGRLVPEKGVLDAAEILAALNRRRPARLAVVGEGPAAKAVAARAAALGLSDRLTLRGWLQQDVVVQLCRSAHAVLVPSRSTPEWVEQFGRVIVEAQACGAVVAGYATGSIPEVGGDAAVLVEEGESEALAERLASLSAEDAYEKRRRLGLAHAARYTWEQVARRQAEFYRQVVEGGGELGRTLPRSPRERRAAARREFGPTAWTPAGRRPFAFPVLRRGGVIPSVIGAAIDSAAELRARTGRE